MTAESGFLLSDQAEQDMLGVWAYIAGDNQTAADRLWQRLTEAFSMLARQPLLGETCGELGDALRRFSVGNYVIYYQPLSSGVLIVRVLHGARDVTAIL